MVGSVVVVATVIVPFVASIVDSVVVVTTGIVPSVASVVGAC